MIGALHVPATRAGLPVSGKGQSGRGYVWHCSVRLGPKDRTLPDAEWAGIARRLLDGAGIATADDDGGPRWIAVRHADDHIHIAAVLVREDTGRRFWPHHDYRGLRCTAQELETELGLTRTADADRTAGRRPGRAEVEIAARQGIEPARVELARVVREAAVAAHTADEFADVLRGHGYLIQFRRLPSGDAIGYTIAFARHPDWTLPAWNGAPGRPEDGRREEKYYNAYAGEVPGFLCLDRKLVRTRAHPRGFEACDLLGTDQELIHVKKVSS